VASPEGLLVEFQACTFVGTKIMDKDIGLGQQRG
jgi:hypothetical protein